MEFRNFRTGSAVFVFRVKLLWKSPGTPIETKRLQPATPSSHARHHPESAAVVQPLLPPGITQAQNKQRVSQSARVIGDHLRSFLRFVADSCPFNQYRRRIQSSMARQILLHACSGEFPFDGRGPLSVRSFPVIIPQ